MWRLLSALLNARSALALAEIRAEKAWVKQQLLIRTLGIGLLVTAGVLGTILSISLLADLDSIDVLVAAFALALAGGLALLAAVMIRASHHPPLFWLTRTVVKADLARLGLKKLLGG